MATRIDATGQHVSKRPVRRKRIERHGFMARIYVQMAGAVAVSSAAAYLAVYDLPLSHLLFRPGGLTPAGWVVTLAPLALAIALGAGVQRLSAEAARLLLLVYATLMGLSLGGVFHVYSAASIGFAFLASAAGFAALAAIGTTARRDFGPVGSFLTIVLFGVIAAMLANLFVRSPTLDLLLAGAGIIVFAGLTAFDVQRLRQMHVDRTQNATVGALILYLDLINIALSLLRIVGRGRK